MTVNPHGKVQIFNLLNGSSRRIWLIKFSQIHPISKKLKYYIDALFNKQNDHNDISIQQNERTDQQLEVLQQLIQKLKQIKLEQCQQIMKLKNKLEIETNLDFIEYFYYRKMYYYFGSLKKIMELLDSKIYYEKMRRSLIQPNALQLNWYDMQNKKEEKVLDWKRVKTLDSSSFQSQQN